MLFTGCTNHGSDAGSASRPSPHAASGFSGAVVILAAPCVGAGANPAKIYYPVHVQILHNGEVVFDRTIAGGRPYRVALVPGSYAIRTLNIPDEPAAVTVPSATVVTVRMGNVCR